MYTAFLLGEPHYSTCCRLAELVDISHDSVNRFLQREDYTPKDLFNQAEQQLELKGGVLSVDDSVLDKPYSHHMAFVGHFWSGKHHCVVKGINLITLYYTDKNGHHLPIDYRIYNKADGKTKNDYFLEMLAEVRTWGVEPEFVTGDSWYSGTKNLKFIKNGGLGSLFALKSNRLISIEKGKFIHISALDIPEEGLEVWLRDFGKVKVFRTMLKDEQRHYAVHLPDESALANFNREDFLKVHDKHWKIEEYHRVIKQVCHVEHFQVRTEVAIRNHIFASLLGFVQLQKMCTAELISNCYRLQRDLFNDVITNFIKTLIPEIKNLNPQFNHAVNA
jgi:hypothetical protein